MSRMGCAIDQLIAIFSPQAALRRTFWREAYAKRSQYAAAKSPRTIGGWSPVDSPVNTLLGNSLAPVRSRVRQLVRDFPIPARAVEIGTTYTVGDGIRFQSRVKDPSGKLDKKRIQLIEDEFAFWMDEADIAGRLHYYEIMALAKRQDLETGEFLIVKKLVSEPGRRLPLALQV